MTSMSCLSTSEPRHFGDTSWRTDGGGGVGGLGLEVGLLSFVSVVTTPTTTTDVGRSSLDMFG